MDYKYIKVQIENGLGTITLNRSPVNVLNIAMMEEINEVLASLQGEKDLKVVLFDAEGKCFSAGVDVGEHMGDMAPKMAAHSDNIYLNAELFTRIETIYNNRNTVNLNSEQIRLVEVYFQNFVLAGAKLNESEKHKIIFK